MNCVICQIRKPRRHCPGVQGDICSICCGTEREQSVDCPLECTYLQGAHEHERPPELDPATIPNQDITVDEEFLRTNEVLMAFISIGIFESSIKTPGVTNGVTDWDVREAIEALVKTNKTLQSGIYYEAVPENRYAADIASSVRGKLEDIKQREIEASGASTIEDATVLGILVFLQRLEYSRNNGRKRSRAFLDFLRGFYIPTPDTEAEAGIVNPDLHPDTPRVIL